MFVIFYRVLVFNAYWMIFFIWMENNISLSRHWDFRVFDKSTTFKICDVIREVAAHSRLHFRLFFWNPFGIIQLKFGPVLVQLIPPFWRLETSSRSIFNEMAVYCDILIFSWWCSHFLDQLSVHLQNSKKPQGQSRSSLRGQKFKEP